MDNLKLSINYQQPVTATIQARYSVRAYQSTLIPMEKKEVLQQAARTLSDDRNRFAWFESKPGNILADRLSTYGFIKGATVFLVGILPKGAKHDQAIAIRFGYHFEQLILKATALGLGTCWVGGTFNPATFAKDVGLKRSEQIVMVSPVGYAADSKHFINDISVRAAKSRSRLPWEELFFSEEPGHPLSEKEADDYAQPLEMVRLAPSAVNAQPWRVIRDAHGFHFYGAEVRYYGVKKINFLRDNDIGIAMAHFALTCRELGLRGKWQAIENKNTYINKLTYFASWLPVDK